MTRTGIDDPGRPEDDPDGEPEPLARWIEAGIPHEEAEGWRRWRFQLTAAMAWRQARVLDGLRAAQWSTAGVTPTTVNLWRTAGIDATEAVTWHEFGFALGEARRHKANGLTAHDAFDRSTGGFSLGSTQASFGSTHFSFGSTHFSFGSAQARFTGPGGAGGRSPTGAPSHQKFVEAGVAPQVVQSYIIRQWMDDIAVTWAKEGIDAAEAELWKALGLRPAEAGRLVRQGSSIGDTVRDWWRAGIPIDEVADWIGAGLKPAEAADQRARGITAQQAATLRALRDDPDPP